MSGFTIECFPTKSILVAQWDFRATQKKLILKICDEQNLHIRVQHIKFSKKTTILKLTTSWTHNCNNTSGHSGFVAKVTFKGKLMKERGRPDTTLLWLHHYMAILQSP